MKISYTQLFLTCGWVSSCLYLNSCSLFTQGKIAATLDPATKGMSTAGVDAYVPGGMDKAGQAGAKTMAVTSEEALLNLKFNEEEAYFTNPDDPDALIPEIEEAFSQKGKIQAWYPSYEDALQQARREGKPVFIWFHDSKRSPASNNLGKELLDTRAFSDWATKNVIRVRFDSGKEKGGSDLVSARQRYVSALQAKFGLRGKPSYATLSLDGRLMDATSGYTTGTADSVMRTLEHAVKQGNTRFKELKQTLMPQGFREWTGANGRKIFAKMTRQSPSTDEIWFKEYDGHITKAKLSLLIPADREWLKSEAEKKEKPKGL